MVLSKKFVEAIEKDDVFLLGEEKGLEKGLEQGLEQGQVKKAFIAIRNMLKKGFDPAVIADILEVEPAFVLEAKAVLAKEPEIVKALRSQKEDAAAIAKQFGFRKQLVEAVLDSVGKKGKRTKQPF